MNVKTLEIALKACGGSQSELARRIGTSRAVVNKWVKVRSVPNWRIEALLKVAGQRK